MKKHINVTYFDEVSIISVRTPKTSQEASTRVTETLWLQEMHRFNPIFDEGLSSELWMRDHEPSNEMERLWDE